MPSDETSIPSGARGVKVRLMRTILPPFRSVARLAFGLVALGLCLLLNANSQAYPLGGVTFRLDAPFAGASGVHSLSATGLQSLVTVAGWADLNATVPANLYQWWWLLGVDSGTGNGALIDGTESMTVQFDKSVGAAWISFLYTGGTGGTTNNLARITISGFASDPGATAVTHNSPRISHLNYAAGALSFDYLNDGGGDFGQLMFADPKATAGRTLKITGAISPNGDATGWTAALYGVDVQEAFAAPMASPTSIPSNVAVSHTTADGLLIIQGFSDRNASTPANLGTYQDECFGVYGGQGGNVVDTNESITLQFAPGVGLSRLDSVYSGGDVVISGFTADPGLVDPSLGAASSSYATGSLTVTLANGGQHSFYFTNRAASAGQTLRLTVSVAAGSQFGIGGVGYASAQTLIGPDLAGNNSATQTTPDGILTLSAFTDTPGTTPGSLNESGDWFGILGGNNQAIDGTESLGLRFSSAAGLSGLGVRYTSGKVIVSGFASDPGFIDPSGVATGVAYSAGTLSYTFNSSVSPELMVAFSNPLASAGKTLSMHTDGASGSQIALTRILYSAGPVTLSLKKVGNQVVLTWPTGVLLEATNVNGTYNTISGASSPYTNSLSETQRFFRVKVQ